MSGARNRSLLLTLAAAAGAALAGCFWGDNESGRPTPAVTQEPGAVPPATTAQLGNPTPLPTPPDRTLAEARELLHEGRYAEARDAFAHVAATAADPSVRAEALLGAGRAASEVNDQQAALADFEAALGVAPAGSNAAVRAAYLYLKQLNASARFAEAATFFSAGPGRAGGSSIESYYRFEGGRAFAGAGDPVSAGALWARLLADTSTSVALKTMVYREQASVARAADDPASLARALDGVIAFTGVPEARFERAMLAREAGDSDTFAFQLRRLIAEDPASWYSVPAIEALVEAGVVVDPGEAGLALYRRGLYQRAIDLLAPAVESAGDADALAFRAFYLAASYEDLGEPAEAVRYYDIAAGSGSSLQFVHRAQYWAARVEESTGEVSSASARYAAIVSGKPGEFSQEAAFRAGYVLYQSGDSAGALNAWQGLSAGSARLEYWRGRALAEAGRAEESTAAYRRAVELGPLDFHGLEAKRALGEAPPLDVRYRVRNLDGAVNWGVIASWIADRVGGTAPDGPGTAACELMAAGLRREAEAEVLGAGLDSPWGTFVAMREASECGLTNVAAQLAVMLSDALGVASHERPRELLRVAYPVDFRATLVREAEKAGVDPLFLAALVRQESFWDPEALSLANAYGLTQVIPPTGEAIAAELGVAGFEPSVLWRPALSLEFGAYYLGGQLTRYGNPLVALAAYNAGPGNAARWAEGENRTLADLVERIDFVETKNYVTYIYEGYAHYLVAWGD